MRLVLSCVCCGSSEFKKDIPIESFNVEGNTYLHHEDLANVKVACSKCGLEDYVRNLMVEVVVEN